MNRSLALHARDTDDVAAGLQVFLDEIPQREPREDVASSIDELIAVSKALRTLDLDFAQLGSVPRRIAEDLDLVLRSLECTFKSIRDMFAQTRMVKYSGNPPYGALWADMAMAMRDEGYSLFNRLETYSAFLCTLVDSIRGRRSIDVSNLSYLRNMISRFLQRQQPLEAAFNGLSFAPAPRPTPRPPPRTQARPPMPGSFPTYPTYYPTPPYPTAGSTSSEDWNAYVPPSAPEPPVVPLSPTTSTSSDHTFSSAQTWSSNTSAGLMHWATKVFDGRHNSTPLRAIAHSTVCNGEESPYAMDRLVKERFYEVLLLSFESADVHARLFYRPEDRRARILCLARNRFGQPAQYCLPLSCLKLVRKESSVRLLRLNREENKLELWANFSFAFYERMVLFYCAFVALKGQDKQKPHAALSDWFQEGEKEEYGGRIEDGQSHHALRIYKDKDSKCVRLEAKPLRGAMADIPIWTAFVTQYVGTRSRSWMRKTGERTIQLSQLHPYVFADAYHPPRSSTGAYQLRFTSRRDADHFIHQFQSIRI